jgi:N-acetylmuramoyl-L-alanine amidase
MLPTRPLRLLSLLLVAMLTGAGLPAPMSAADDGPISRLKVVGSPFYPNGDGVRERVKLVIKLSAPAALTVEVRDFDDKLMRRLLDDSQRAAGRHVFYWGGKDSSGKRVADGPYTARVVAKSSQGSWHAKALFTKARKPIFAARPSAIVVAVDPGHGDVYSEAGRYAPDGTHEKEYNLDIALRLRAMLRGAGVTVAITRTLDQGVNTPEWDRNDDGTVGYDDELQARCDVANIDRADLFISIHNNLATNTRVGGPSTFYRQDRVYAAESYRLATLVQQNMLARLDLYATDSWKPSRSHGVLSHNEYFVLSAYSPPRRPRPTLMPAVLSEGVFLTHPYELYLIKQPRVRTSMAAAYYDAAQKFVAGRQLGVRVDQQAGPESVSVDSAAEYQLRVTNTGMATAKGWKLEARVVPAVPLYDGSGQPGEVAGSVSVPTLERGQQRTVTLNVAAPAAGKWLVKVDVVLADGRRLSDLGLPVLQIPLRVTN